MKKLEKWKIKHSEFVINHQWCRVRKDKVELPNGQVVDDFFVNVRPDIVLVLPVTNQQEIVFVRQYRHGVKEILLELPAGAFYPEKETPKSAAIREFTEETGYTSDPLIKLATLYDNPVKDTNQIHLYLAKNAHKIKEQVLDITEEIEVILVPVSQVLEKINAGEICVAGTLAAIFLGLQRLSNG